MKNHQKLFFFEALRAVCCVIVILHHMSLAFFPNTIFVELFNGQACVIFFFSLTGFILRYQCKKRNIIRYMAERYVRLLPAILVSIFMAYLLMENQLIYTQLLGEKYELNSLLGYYNFKSSFSSMLQQIFVTSYCGRPLYNTPFWTIKYEFWEAIFLASIIPYISRCKYRYYIYICLIIILSKIDVRCLPMIFGCIAADLIYSQDDNVIHKLVMDVNKWGIFITGIAILTYQILKGNSFLIKSIGTFLIMLSIPYLVPVQKVLCRKVLISISKVSYELYALHWPIINSFTCLLIYYISEHIEFVKAALLSCAITLPVIYLLAILANSYGSKVIIRVVACLNKYLNADTEKE